MALRTAIRETIRAFLPVERKPHRIRKGPLRGHVIFTSWHDYPGAIRGDTEAPLLEWFSRNVLPGETWLDIGAHYGYTAMALSRLVGPGGRVFAFEPVAETVECMARTRELNQLSQLWVVPLGLGLGSGEPSQSVPVYRGMAYKTIDDSDVMETIPVAGFDAIWGSLCGGKPDVHGVKIDVQGMEREVIEGMACMLRAMRPRLVVEFHRGVDRAAILALLNCCGYSRSRQPVEPGCGDLMDNKSYIFTAPA